MASRDQVAIVHGFRSGLEADIQAQLRRSDVPVHYELVKIPYVVHKNCTYTPDFLLPNGIFVESKGRFVTADRQKHLMIQEQYPLLDIRFVFSRSTARLGKASRTTYAMWCTKNGFQYADVAIPRAWLDEPACPDRIEQVRELFAHPKNKKAPPCPL